ncbi:MAG TPA: peptidase U32 family protein [Devosia sp.]
MQLISPASTPVAFRDAVDAGADAVQCGFANETNAAHLLALHFTYDELAEAIAYARPRGTQVIVAIDSFMRAGAEELWTKAVDIAVGLGADAILVSDIGLLAYAADKYPEQRRHLAVQASAATTAHVGFLAEAFGIKRAVLPRGMLVEEVIDIAARTDCEIEVAAGSVSLRRSGSHPGPSLDMLAHVADLAAAGVTALKVEDAPRGAAYIRTLRADLAAALPEAVAA